MRAISLWQPYASLWLSSAKIHETRHWSTKYRGPVAVHAAKRLDGACGIDVDDICIGLFGMYWRRELPRGAMIGVVHLDACLRTQDVYDGPPAEPARANDYACGNFGPHRFAWRRTDYRMLTAPVPYKGRQSFFSVPDELLI